MSGYQPQKSEASELQPRGLKKLGNKELKITWSDGHESVYGFRFLRQNCQCAHCVDEWSGKALLARESVPADLEGLQVGLIGQYAVRVDFSDGHSTGLYAFKHLRQICPCPVCETGRRNAAPEPKQYMDKSDMRSRES